MDRIARRKLLAAAGATAAIQTTGCRKSETPEVAGPTKAERFAEKITEDIAAGLRAPLSYIGERLGIFRTMAESGALTLDELARKTGLNARYLRNG